jgi:hypothetical protein
MWRPINKLKKLFWLSVLISIGGPLFLVLLVVVELILHSKPPNWFLDFVGYCIMKMDEADGRFIYERPL